MSKIYVFGIGGTGSRVMRSVTMLLASGVEFGADAIVPIIIDPDSAGGDVERTATLMRHYGEIREKLDFSDNYKNRFFRTEIRKIMNDFHLPLWNTEDYSFEEYIGLHSMTPQNQALAEILFSRKNLNSRMNVGFKGNPNVGSVVLNQFEGSEEFQNFANDFSAGDKIFIISSIFGGTGASGFPLLLKTLRTGSDFANPDLVNNAHIGAITVLPYFKVNPSDNSEIDSATFMSKAKAALEYYNRTISRAKEIDNLYYIADEIRSTTYENNEGGEDQKNNAHFVELAAALALVDFSRVEKPANTKHMEFGIETDSNQIIFENLGSKTAQWIKKPMTQFLLFSKYLIENRKDSYDSQPWAKDRDFDSNFLCDDFMKTLKVNILSEYVSWLEEMTKQDRAFKPFDLHTDRDRVFDLVNGIVPSKVWTTTDRNYDLFNNRLNGIKLTDSTKGKKEQQIVELFYTATEQLVKEKLNIK